MKDNNHIDRLIEAAEMIQREFEAKSFGPIDALYVLFVAFLNLSICSGEPIISLLQLQEFLSKWSMQLYDASKLAQFEGPLFENLIKDFDLKKFAEDNDDL